MGCKSPVACLDNKKQNFKGKWANRQCKPWNWGTLVSFGAYTSNIALLQIGDSNWFKMLHFYIELNIELSCFFCQDFTVHFREHLFADNVVSRRDVNWNWET